ncbi:MAG: glycosyltransferase involved in cell wall biosynthesis [Verrucomicrobiales bacterium]|jgi:glycosyltransferase involved in cell wall biosynthesis
MQTLAAAPTTTKKTVTEASRPRILILAFDCHPTLPSLPVIAFKMCRELGKLADVTVVSRKQDDHFEIEGTDTQFINVDAIKKPLDGIADILRGGRSVGWTTKTAFTYPSYIAFERAVWKRYKKDLNAGVFDAVLRISPMSPILVSPMAKWCPVPFIIGPVNGGLPFPKEAISVQKKEREWLNPLRKFHNYLPYAKSSYNSAAAILAGFQHTFDGLPEKSLKNAINYPEIGYDPDLFFPAEKLPPTDKIKFVFVGRLVAGKAADSLVDAFAISEKLQQHQLTIVGEGPDRKIMEDMIEKHKLQDCVKLVGTKSQGEVGEIFRESHVFAFPSIRELGAGVVIEAMGSGLPCIVFNSGAQGCLVDEDRGVPVKLAPRKEMPPLLGAAMQRYIDEPRLLQQHRQRALEYAAGYTWRHKAENILETIRWTIGETEEKPEFYPL